MCLDPFSFFHFPQALQKHTEKKHQYLRFQCFKCPKVFNDTTHLIKHLGRADKNSPKGPGAKDREPHRSYQLEELLTIYTCRKGSSKEGVVIVTNLLKLVNFSNISL